MAHGLGVAIVPAAALPPSNGSITIKAIRPAITRRIGIVRLADRPIAPASQAFLDIFRPVFFAATREQMARSKGRS